jgi:hypothetical protein
MGCRSRIVAGRNRRAAPGFDARCKALDIPDGLDLKIAVAFYPRCSVASKQVATPLILIGELDDWAPAQNWLNDIDTDARMFVIRNAKAGRDIYLPITPEIAFAISLAVYPEVKPHPEVKETDFVFPGCRADIAARQVADPWPSSAAFLFHGRGGPKD